MTTYQIAGRYSDLGTSDERADWIEEYAGALSRGCSHDEAEVLASNCAQRAGYNVNRTGGLSICESTLIIED